MFCEDFKGSKGKSEACALRVLPRVAGFSSCRQTVKAVTCVDGQPQSVAAAQILARMLKPGDAVWVYRALKVAEAVGPQTDEAEAQRSVQHVAELLRQSGCEASSELASVMSPGAAVSRFVGERHADVVAMGSHGPGRVLHKSLASYLMQSPLLGGILYIYVIYIYI